MKLWKIVLLDTLGVLLMIAAVLTGWLPGPGGLPLFIIGLSLLAVHHSWAERYITLLKKYADKVGEMIFDKDPMVQLIYDIVSPVMFLGGVYLLLRRSAVWMLSVGIFLLFISVTIFLGNRDRWPKLRNRFKKNKKT